VLSEFFRNGQVIETFRGKGIWQPAIDLAIEKVNDGGWVCILSFGFKHSVL
jgi:monolysocardiolipin acyltransferase